MAGRSWRTSKKTGKSSIGTHHECQHFLGREITQQEIEDALRANDGNFQKQRA